MVSAELVDESTDRMFEGLLETIVELKKQNQPTLEIENLIEFKLAQIYSLSEEEIALIKLSESTGDIVVPAIIDRSEVVSS